MASIIDGKAVAAKVESELQLRVARLNERGIEPCLMMVLVGDDPASQVYIRRKGKACKRVGVRSESLHLPADTSESDLLERIRALNEDPTVHGILVQLPLPETINPYTIIDAIDFNKDVDGFHLIHAGHLVTDRTGFPPCTPKGVMRLLREYDVPIRGSHAVVVGRSRSVGRPMAAMLLAAHATVTTCHRHTKDTAKHTAMADIVVVAVGKAGLVKADWVKPGAVVIDVGINRLPSGKLAGDVAFDEVAPKAGMITPVPGGVGPMTVAMLIENTCLAAEQLNGLASPASS